MWARIVTGLLSLGVALGALSGLFFPSPTQLTLEPTLIDDYVRVVGELYAKGESLSTVESRLDAVAPHGAVRTLSEVAARNGIQLHSDAADDVAAVLAAIAPNADTTAAGEPRLVASGRGSAPSTTEQSESVTVGNLSATDAFPQAGRVSSTKGDAALRTEPALSAAVVRVIPRGSEVVLLGIERGQAVEGADDRWYHVRHADASGYVYYTLLEPVR